MHFVKKSTEAKRKQRAKKQFYRAQIQAELRQKYFVGKEDILIEAQLNKEQKLHTSPTISMPKPIPAPERAKLAELTGGGIPVSLSTRWKLSK